MTLWTENTRTLVMSKEQLLQDIAKEKKVSKDKLEYAMEAIAFHESKGKADAVQKLNSGGDGAGRGKYQYEIGDKASAETARNRLLSYYKDVKKTKPPEWVAKLPKDFDPASLHEEQQDMLFLADHRMRPNSNFAELNTIPVAEWWGKYHQTESDPVKIERFKADEAYYNANVAPTKKIDKALQAVKPTGVTVNRGDTLYSLSKSTGVPVQRLMQLNGIADPSKLMVGQQLKVQ